MISVVSHKGAYLQEAEPSDGCIKIRRCYAVITALSGSITTEDVYWFNCNKCNPSELEIDFMHDNTYPVFKRMHDNNTNEVFCENVYPCQYHREDISLYRHE